LNYYIPPKKPSRGDESSRSPDKSAGMGAILDIKSRAGPMSEDKKSVAFSNAKGGSNLDKSGTKGMANLLAKVEGITMGNVLDNKPELGNSKHMASIDPTYDARKMMIDTHQRKAAENSPTDGKSRASRKSKIARRKTIVG
jgi:hypothetical protein